jgi:hypothetical protein
MQKETGRSALAAFSGAAGWLLPAWGCPVCLSAFAGTMSALGLGFVATEAVLTPLTVAFLGGALVALGFGARRRRRYGPVLLGVVGAGLLAGSKFWPAQMWLGYGGLACILVGSLWNSRIAAGPRLRAAGVSARATAIQ